MRVLVSIVNYKTGELVCQMLSSLLNYIDPKLDKVIIVDNNSGDDSVTLISNYITQNSLDEYVKLITSQKNGGFSYGNNTAILFGLQTYNTKPDYVWLLNPDTCISNDALTPLINFFINNPQAGILGSCLLSENDDKQVSAFRFPSLMSELLSGLGVGIMDRVFSKYLVAPREEISTKNIQVDWVAGASMFIRYELISKIGLMDEQYFLYFEETDYCLQAKKNGWQCWYVADSKVLHYMGKSTGVNTVDSLKRRRPKYWFESRQYYFLKNHGLFYTIVADATLGTAFFIKRVRCVIQKKVTGDPVKMCRDFWRNSIFLSWLK